MKAKIYTTVTLELEGTFEGESVDECIAACELETKAHGDIISRASVVQSRDDDPEQ